jgi:type VI secretion system protein ImpH
VNAPLAAAPEASAERPVSAAVSMPWMADVAAEPWRFDLWYLLRWIDAKHPDLPALGRAPKPDLEPIRIGQEPSLAFAPAQIHALALGDNGRPPRLEILGFGMFGPNGPLPIHLTEYARERVRSHGDRTFARFVDMLHHRFTLLFYRAWADAQPTASLDRPGDDRFSRYAASLVHLGEDSLRDRDAVCDHAKLFVSGHLVRETRNAEGLERILATFFQASVRVEPWVFDWLPLAPEQRTRLGFGRVGEQIGVGAVVGAAVPDVQSRFRVRLGPLSFAQYESHLPGGRAFAQLLAWLRNYIGVELAWDVRLVLSRDEVPSASLGSRTRLGWTTWIGARRRDDDADDLVLVHETIVARTAIRQNPAAQPTA